MDVEPLQKLYGGEMNIYSAMAAVMKETGAIGKDQKNTQQNFKYRGIDSVYNSLHTTLAKHSIFMTPEVLERWREERTNKNGTVLAYTVLRMRYTFYADDGSNVSCIVEGEGMDSGDKSSNKAMAVAHKYALLQCFCIPTAETKDPDAEVHEIVAETITQEQAAELVTLLEKSGSDYNRFLAYFKVTDVKDLPAAKLDKAKTMLNNKIAEKAKIAEKPIASGTEVTS